ncbi:UDP-N-acetylglucosamine diphosphorylase 2 [Glycine max]|nr:UDP-N-acetylglucosamine diphosphorylase 2 [Glycine max]
MREPSSVGFEGNDVVPPQALLQRLKDYDQEHAFALWYELSYEEREFLVKDIESLDLSRIDRIIRCSLRSQGLPVAAIEPVSESSVSTVVERSQEDRERWWKMGLKAISDGELAVLLLSGGQSVDFRLHCLGKHWYIEPDGLEMLLQAQNSRLNSTKNNHLAPLPVAIVGCVPKKVHIEGASETGFKISSIEITDAIKAGLDEPIQPEPVVFVPST